MKNLVLVLSLCLMLLPQIAAADDCPPPNDPNCEPYDQDGHCLCACGNYGEQLGSYLGQVSRSSGGWVGSGCSDYQCVTFVKDFYSQVVNDPITTSWGEAKNAYSLADGGVGDNNNLLKFPQGGSVKPAPGDILCFGEVNHEEHPNSGHVAIVTEVGSNYLKIIDQNRTTSSSNVILQLSLSSSAPYNVGTIGQYYSVQGWLRDPDYTPTPTFIATQAEATISPGGPYYPGEPITCTMKWRNDGTATWHNTTGTGKNYVELVSCNSSGQPPWEVSYFYASGLTPAWKSNQVPCTMQESSVTPGNTATFTFPGKIPLNTTVGQKSIYFGPVYNSQMIQGWNGNGFTITIIDPALAGSEFIPLVGRFNGDIKSDIAVWEPATGDLYVALSNGADEFTPVQGPGTDGSMFQNGWIPSGNGPFRPFAADFSGDGYDDLLLYDESAGNWFVAYNWGDHFAPANGPGQYNSWKSGWGGNPYIPLVADFSADGYTDIGVYHPTLGRWSVAYNWGGYFTPAYGPYDGNSWLDDWKDLYGPYTPFAADFSGDGAADVALMRQSVGRWFVAMNDYTPLPRDFIPETQTWISTGWGESPKIPFAADFSGDGYADICVFHPTYGRWYIAYNWGDHFTKATGGATDGSWLTSWKTSASGTYEPLVGDFSGDGTADIGLYEPSEGRWYIAFNWANHDPYPIFEIENGVYEDDSWLDGWGLETGGGAKLTHQDGDGSLPHSFNLFQNYPNPFNPATTISYSLPEATHVKLEVFNILGQRVDALLDADQPAGDYQLTWDASHFASGIYFYRLQTEAAVETKKMLLLK